MKPLRSEGRRHAARFAVVLALCTRPHVPLVGAPPLPGGADLFPEGPEGSRNLVVVGLFLASDLTRLRLASTLLARGTVRLRKEGTPDPIAEVVLGETLEEMARRGILPPDGARFVRRADFAKNRTVETYDGEAFRLALGSLPADPDSDRQRDLRERASAGALRARFPFPETSLVGLFLETSSWLAIVEESRTDSVVSFGAKRLAKLAAPSLGRLLLASGRTDDLEALSGRLAKAARRVRVDLPKDAAGRRLVLASTVVRRMSGDGIGPVPAGGLGRTGTGGSSGADRGRDRAARARSPDDDGRTGRASNGLAQALRADPAGARLPPRLARRPPRHVARDLGPVSVADIAVHISSVSLEDRRAGDRGLARPESAVRLRRPCTRAGSSSPRRSSRPPRRTGRSGS